MKLGNGNSDPTTWGKTIWSGVDPNSTFGTGSYAWDQFKTKTGLGDEYQDEARKLTGYTDPTGAANFSGAQWNTLGKDWASRTGNVFQDWTAPTVPTPTPETPAPVAPTASDTSGQWGSSLKLPDAIDAPNPFSYTPFIGPTTEEALNDPGYQFALQQGLGQINASHAAKGDLFTGGTIKGLVDYGTQAGSQQYDKVRDRKYQEWAAAQGMSADEADRNWAQNKDVYDREVDASVLANQAYTGDRAFDFGKDVWNKEYQSGEARWQKEFDQRVNEFKSSDQFRRYVYGTDDEYRRWRDQENDAWKREVMDEERRRFLATLGAGAA